MLHALLLTAALTAATEKPRLAVLDIQALGASKEDAVALTEAATAELSRRAFFDVVSSRDIQTLLGVERQKAILGCGEDSSSCMAELASALGSRFVLSGTLTKLGDALQLSLQMLDSSKGQPVGRSVRLANDAGTLARQLPWALAEATATPLPPPPSKALPWTLVGVGAGAAVTGAVMGIDALSKDAALQADLNQPAETGVFRSLVDYRAQASGVGLEKSLSLGLLLGGAALLGAGIALFPSDGATGGVALVPTGNGVAVVGALP